MEQLQKLDDLIGNQKQQSKTLQETDLFFTLQAGQERLKKIKQFAYIVIGSKKSGSSALCNAILKNPIVGKANQLDEEQVYYVPFNQDDQNIASMSHQFDSVTHIPNVWNFKKHSTIIDMPGLGNRNTHKQQTSFWYFMGSCFQKIKKVKFLLTVSQTQLLSKNIFEFTKPFFQFIGLFNLHEQKLSKIYKSALVVVTHAKMAKNCYLRKIEEVIMNLQTKKNMKIINRSRQVIEFLKNIVQRMGVEVFQYAKINKLPDNTKLTEKMLDQSWQFLDNSDSAYKPIKLLDRSQYLLCIGEQKQCFQKYIDQKIGHMKNFVQIFKIGLSLASTIWNNYLQQTNGNRSESDGQLSQKNELFAICSRYTQSSNSIILKQSIKPLKVYRLNYSSTWNQLLSLIYQMIILCHQIQQIAANGLDQFVLILRDEPQKILKMMNRISNLCYRQSQLYALEAAINVFSRQSKNFSILINFDRQIIREKIDRLNYSFNYCCQVTTIEFIQSFLSKISLDVANRLFNDVRQIQNYQRILALYQVEATEKTSPSIQYKVIALQAKRKIHLKNRCNNLVMATNAQILQLICHPFSLSKKEIISKIPKTIQSCLCILIDMDSEQVQSRKYRDLAQQLLQVTEDIFEPLFYTKIMNTAKQLQKINNELQLFKKWGRGDLKNKLKVLGLGGIINSLLKIRSGLDIKEMEFEFTQSQIGRLSQISILLYQQFRQKGSL